MTCRARARHTKSAPRPRRMRRASGGVAIGVSAVLIATASISSSAASFTDVEYVRGDSAGALSCLTPGIGTSTATGRMLGGTLIDLNLDSVVDVAGVTAVSDGTTTLRTPASADPVTGSNDTAFQDPLSVAALNAIFLDLDDLLKLPIDPDVGVYNQYARAGHTAGSAGASGAVADSGGIALTTVDDPLIPGDERPTFATLELGSLLERVLGAPVSSAVTGITDLRLEVGAVAAAAVLDGCNAAWSGALYENLERDYAIAGLDLEIDSPTVAALSNTVTSLGPALDAVANSTELANGLVDAVGTITGTLGLGTPVVNVGLTAGSSLLSALLSDTVSDDAGIVEISPATGTVRIDLEKLLGDAYGTTGINGLGPNTELLLNGPVLTALTSAITAALQDWVDDVVAAVRSSIQVTLTITVPLQITAIDVATLTVVTGPNISAATPVSLDSLIAGTAPVTVKATLTGLFATVCAVPVLVGPLCNLVTSLVSGLTGPGLTALTQLLGATVSSALEPTLVNLETTLNSLITPIVTLIGATLGWLFGADAVLSLVVNAQNDPDPLDARAHAELSSWSGIPGSPTANPSTTGRYDVAAIVIGVVGFLDIAELVLARGSVGSNSVP